MKEFLGNLAILTGAIVGLLKVIDWLLLDSQKNWLIDKFESMWIWLSDQRMGKFTSLVRNRKIQISFSIFSHFCMIMISLLFLARVFLGIEVNATLQLGSPRIYKCQVWIDIIALFFSAIFVSKIVHPKITFWIANTDSLKQYYWRSFTAFLRSFGVGFIVLLLQLPIIYFLFYAPIENGEAAVITYVENVFGGKVIVLLLHAVTTFISAPVLIEMFMLQTVFFLSVYWLVFVIFLIIFFRVIQFILLRIIENKKGPVLALSGLLIGIGAIIKVVII